MLDLFAGTGATGIEALSRGAAQAHFVDRAPAAVSTIRRNLALTGMEDRAEVRRAEVSRFLTGADGIGDSYDLVLCDPPYSLGSPELDEVLRAIGDGGLRGGTWTVALTRGEEFHPCHSATLGDREAAPVRRQPRRAVPADTFGLETWRFPWA